MTSDSAFRCSVGTRVVGASVGLAVALLLAVGDRAGAQWFHQNPLPQERSLRDIAFADGTQIGLAVYPQGVFRTEDGGVTWWIPGGPWGAGDPLAERPDLQAVSFIDEDTATVVGFSGGSAFNAYIARTTDGGVTWTEQIGGTEMPGVPLVDVFFNGPDSGIAVGLQLSPNDPPVILLTSDGGTTWTLAPQIDAPAGAGLFGVSFSDPDTGIAVGFAVDPDSGAEGGLILRTTDGGQTWSQRPQGPDGTMFRGATFTGDAGIVVGSHGAIFTTNDAGENWVQRDSGTDRNLLDVTCLDALNCIVVGGGPGSGEGVTAGRIVLRTTDGGESWTTLLVEDERSTLRAVTSYDSNGPVLMSVGWYEANGSGGVILRSTDGGDTWQRLNRSVTDSVDLFLRSVVFTDVDTGIVVGDEGTILRTADGGSTWVRQTSGTTLGLHGVSFMDEANGIVVGGAGGGPLGDPTSGTILRTMDGGATWSSLALHEQDHQMSFSDVSCVDASHCTAVGGVGAAPDYWGVIVRTEDGGSNWILQHLEPNSSGLNFTGVHCTSSLDCVVIGGTAFEDVNALILQTMDGGDTWSRTVEEGFVLADVFFTSDQVGTGVGWREGNNGVVLRTTDGGTTWTIVSELGGVLRDVSFAGDRGVAVGSNGTLLRTTDGGETWTQDVDDLLPSFSLHRHMGVAFLQEGQTTVVGGDGLILRTVGEPTFPLVLRPENTVACAPDDGTTEVGVLVGIGSAGGYEGSVALSTSGEPSGVVSDLEPDIVDAPRSASMWTITMDAIVPTGQHVVTLTADDGAQQQIANFRLGVVDPGSSPGLVLPVDGATDVTTRPTFTWQPIPGVDAYRIQVALDNTFDEPVIDAEVAGASFTPPDELNPDTQYFWRVQGIVEGTHGCSLAWSAASSFTTAPIPIAEVTPEGLGFEVPVGGGDDADVSVTNAGTGDLVWALSTAQPAAVPSAHPAGAVRVPARTTGRPHAASDDSDAALDLASVLGEPLPGLRPSPPAAGLVDCGGEPGLIVHDDGTVETGYSANPEVVDQVAFVDRFTPNAYPATLTSVCAAFISTGPTGLDFEIVVYDDDGPQGGAGTELGALPASVEGIPVVPPISEAAAWFSIDISALGASISSGSAYIGVRWVPSDPGVFLAADESPEHPVGFSGGYWWHDVGNVWAPTESAFANYRSLFVRAKSIPGGCHDPATIPWLSVSPNAGITPAGGTTPVQVTVDAAGLEVGQHTANLCIASNDPENPMVAVPISLTVVGAELTLDQQGLDFGDVFVNDTSDPQVVTLQNAGSLAATGLGFQVTVSGFEVDASACGTTLAVGASCPVSVTFAPTESGPAEGTLEVTSETGLPVVLALAGNGVRETEVFTPRGLEVDSEPIISDANGVFEPGELAPVAPVWRHDGVAPQDLSGIASNLTGPEGPTYSLLVAEADYGLVEPGAIAGCQESDACYEMDIGPAGMPRPALHWDAMFDEVLSDDTSHTWTLHIGDSFADVPRESPFYQSIEALLHSGVTGGCTDSEYCPGGFSNRAQMPVFVLRALEGLGYQPPACSAGAPTFADVPIGSPFCPWIKELVERGVVSGCGGDSYCPNAPVTRAQMAIFLLRTLEGAGYTPPDCTGEFTDVTCPSPFAAWVEELARRGVTSGCSETEFCPSAPVTRAQMATFIIRTFGLELYGS